MLSIQEIEKEQAWAIRHEVMYPELPFDSIKLIEDADAVHLGLFDDGRLTSAVSLFEDGNSVQFRKFATLDKYQGKGYGSRLLSHVIEHSRLQKADRLWCNARVKASGFYRKFNFSETDIRFNKDGYEFVVMELKLQVGS